MIPLSTGMHNYAVIMGSRSFCGCRDSRMQHVFHTWGKEANSLSFYVGERPPLPLNSNMTSLKLLRPYITELKGEPFLTLAKDYDYNIPILFMSAVKDNEYPARHKSFEMLRHWCTHLLPHFQWFVRADDDTYLRVVNLERLLTGLDHTKVVSTCQEINIIFFCKI